jgi:hypothetical protein
MVICDAGYRLQAFLQGEDFMMQALLLDMLLALGTMALLISLVVYQIYQIRWLPSHGRQVIAMVTSIRHETGKTAWGISRDNSYLTATWTHPRTGRTYTFWTWIMNSSPAYTKGDLVPVWIDPNDPKRYALNL